MNIKEKQILEELQKGDESGFRRLFDLYYKPLTVFALKYIDSIDEAEDLVQDTFIRFWNNKSFNTISTSFKAYLFQAVKNNCFNSILKNSRFKFEEIESNTYEMIEDELDDEHFEALKSKLKKEIEALPEKGRNIFNALVFDNMKYKEVAEMYGVSVNTVKTHYSRTLSKLRKSLDIVVMIILH